MKKNKTYLFSMLFALGLILVYLTKTMYNIGIASDELGSSPAIILGGEFWNLLHWALLPITLVMMIYTILLIARSNRNV